MADIEIRRAASTGKVSGPVIDANPRLEPGNGAIFPDNRSEGVTIRFHVGGRKRQSELTAWIRPSAFPTLVKAMLDGSPKEAERAFLSALLKRSRRAKRP